MNTQHLVGIMMLVFAASPLAASTPSAADLHFVPYKTADGKPLLNLALERGHQGTRIVGVIAPGAPAGGLGLSFIDAVQPSDDRWMGSPRTELFPASRSAVLVFTSSVSTWGPFSCAPPALLVLGIAQPGTSIETGALNDRQPIDIFALCQSFPRDGMGSQFRLASQHTLHPASQ